MGNGKDMYGLEAVLQAKGVSADKKDWKCRKITHGDPEHKTINIDRQTYNHPHSASSMRVLQSSLLILSLQSSDFRLGDWRPISIRRQRKGWR